MSSGETVLVTGANGFIALHIIGRLLERGYNVIGTVRSQDKADDIYKKFQSDSSDPKLKIEIIEDIIKPGAFDSLLQKEKDIKYILHTASPFKFGFTDDLAEGYKKPAVDGTLNVLKAIHKYGENVVTVVVTSSYASIMNLDKGDDASFTHTETVWNPIEWDDVKDETSAYIASKKLAESAAWNFAKENNVKFNLNTVCPPYVFGPQLFDEDAANEKLNTSNEIIVNLLKSDPNDTKFFNGVSGASIDVRDVAEFHILAFEREGVEGHRLLPIAENFSSQKILNLINEQFPELRGKIGKGDPAGESTIQGVTWNNDETIKLVGGYDFIPLKKQVYDSVKQVLDARNS
ncbi:hypothetical protein WICANDRAFT_29850 [Wickerhamomyces anomalus NRRL Y-366-8]|uniref:NAD-dependent epimerase/dehydratase domain-containing protein n=1 Tax=Wickerhamomyces anomalus (strain ATCC 58044 / CBS 1984 / NCYC 433 / NRRL Y-366-8) TaxID=683960 RepID=A0A1E3P514_WICAA|nr:uncharacterized protein WICANDRAFT_29850 [Wickerhamomyces anomalus NRRL Y-366-8]ODQ60324.1 hypothetical protein WICANDRAFT_29850 [Wickerhamomyces anomalus NRRL Y-366-8]